MEWPLIFIGAMTSFLGTLAGGGGLIGMPAMILYGLPIHQIIAATKFSNTISSFSSFFFLLKSDEIKLTEVLKTVPFALAGGVTGGCISGMIPEDFMNAAALILLTFAFVLSVLKKREKDLPDRNRKLPAKSYPAIFGIGVYDGVFGPGQATLSMYMYFQLGLSYLSSIAYTRFQTFVSCVGAFTAYLFAGMVNFQIAIPLAIGSLIGAQLAIRTARRISFSSAKWIIRGVTLLLIGQIFYQFIQ
ncbi:sulfite exporter TauE/SafE family protein [Bacillus sp. FJAT-42376]|uniref:sulfite exporter TauE/SafE family protein n=1 Tax=Bacillus sp. FJAT-42376 TaxID=2014076 RepID=UPI000F5167FB|nr:sulfite exporter TauE/SafE family protein [Bacillus sp. FJAT-42376]AZB42635.1 sulfite exporter TauE/SafE family protein [Bacillus sp. FJAT-42376]